MSDVGLTASLVNAGLGMHARAILELARPSVRIETRICPQASLKPGASRFGGIPDLPTTFTWPSYRGRPLAFLGQINSSAVPLHGDAGLPRTGTLAFFYEVESMKWGREPADRGCSYVAYFDEAVPLQSFLPPAGVEATTPCELSFTPHVDLPSPRDLLLENIEGQMTDENQDEYSELTSSLSPPCYHHLLGHPQIIQNDMRRAMRPSAADWELLLQLDSDDALGWAWGDVGRIYFWLRKQDLEVRRFENAWLVLQCY